MYLPRTPVGTARRRTCVSAPLPALILCRQAETFHVCPAVSRQTRDIDLVSMRYLEKVCRLQCKWCHGMR